MEKVLQEFRIIETDDGFRIEIKGDKEELRDFVMSLDPRTWMHGEHGPHGWGPFPFGPGGPRLKMKFGRGFGPFGFAWDSNEDDDDDDDHPRRKRGHGRRRGEHGGRGRHGGHGKHGHHAEDDDAADEEIV